MILNCKFENIIWSNHAETIGPDQVKCINMKDKRGVIKSLMTKLPSTDEKPEGVFDEVELTKVERLGIIYRITEINKREYVQPEK